MNGGAPMKYNEAVDPILSFSELKALPELFFHLTMINIPDENRKLKYHKASFQKIIRLTTNIKRIYPDLNIRMKQL